MVIVIITCHFFWGGHVYFRALNCIVQNGYSFIRPWQTRYHNNNLSKGLTHPVLQNTLCSSPDNYQASTEDFLNTPRYQPNRNKSYGCLYKHLKHHKCYQFKSAKIYKAHSSIQKRRKVCPIEGLTSVQFLTCIWGCALFLFFLSFFFYLTRYVTQRSMKRIREEGVLRD